MMTMLLRRGRGGRGVLRLAENAEIFVDSIRDSHREIYMKDEKLYLKILIAKMQNK
jgi:hypothetical protein